MFDELESFLHLRFFHLLVNNCANKRWTHVGQQHKNITHSLVTRRGETYVYCSMVFTPVTKPLEDCDNKTKQKNT